MQISKYNVPSLVLLLVYMWFNDDYFLMKTDNGDHSLDRLIFPIVAVIK